MKKLYILLIALVLVNGALAQGCLPQGIMFTTQAQIDSFQIDYPNCRHIEGNVEIGYIGYSTDITNLNGLSVLTSIGGRLIIRYNDFLTSLNGLANLTTIIGELMIHHNNALTSLSGLANLTSIGGLLDISGGNSALNSLTGLEGLTSIPGNLTIQYNVSLTNLTGLHNVTSIGGMLDIESNDSLTSLTGLEGMTSIAGDLGIYNNSTLTSLTGLNNLTSIRGVWIIWNYALSSLTGLDNIDAGSIQGLYIHNNYTLSTCAVQSICDYLVSPNGTIDIHDNATGCNSQQEVEDSCASIGIESLTPESSVTIYPNPTSTSITIKTPTTGTINIINSSGQQLLQQKITEPSTTINVNALPSGVYFVRMTNERTVELGKFIKP